MSRVALISLEILLATVGLGLLGASLLEPELRDTKLSLTGAGLFALGVLLAAGATKIQIPLLGQVEIPLLGRIGAEPPRALRNAPEVARRELDHESIRTRRDYSAQVSVPGSGAPAFDVLADPVELDIGPGADPLVPMYVLDNAFRIRDWNAALSLAFDRSMEGRRGESVLEWTYLLDNYEEVLDHGVKVFADESRLPSIDIETVRYTSDRYGPIESSKRAYRIPKDASSWQGWLVTLAPRFRDAETQRQFQLDLFRMLETDLVWSEYGLSYDALLSTDSYPALIADILGESALLPPIAPNARVLELGAGTGNVVSRLADPAQRRFVVAVDDNPTMLSLLRSKCRPYLREDDKGPGVCVVKQDATSLSGINDCYFDYAIMNNVLYSLDDPEGCLAETHRVLRPGGELRITGPSSRTNLNRLFRRFRRELRRKKSWEAARADMDRIESINRERLQSMPGFRRKSGDLVELVEGAGFELTLEPTKVYCHQALLLAARRPTGEATGRA